MFSVQLSNSLLYGSCRSASCATNNARKTPNAIDIQLLDLVVCKLTPYAFDIINEGFVCGNPDPVLEGGG